MSISKTENLFRKLYIYLFPHIYTYNNFVDKFIRTLIKEGVIIDSDNFEIGIDCHGKYFKIWIANYPYGDLVRASVGTKFFQKKLYTNLRPSRSTQVAFWEWLYKQGYSPYPLLEKFLAEQEEGHEHDTTA